LYRSWYFFRTSSFFVSSSLVSTSRSSKSTVRERFRCSL
jgi:hypothetical protein